MTRAVERSGSERGWAKAPDFHDDPQRLAAVHEATTRDRDHYLRGGLRPIECRACHACVLVKKTSASHTSVQWNDDARERCIGLTSPTAPTPDDQNRPLLPGAMMPTCPRLSASIDHGVAEGIIPAESPDSDPDGYW